MCGFSSNLAAYKYSPTLMEMVIIKPLLAGVDGLKMVLKSHQQHPHT
jgi:hypothetical protein